MVYDTKKIVEKLVKIESDYNLFDYQIDNIYFWKTIRTSVFVYIKEQTGIHNEAHPSKYNSIYHKIIQTLIDDLYIMRYNALKLRGTKEVLIFRNTRKQLIAGELEDIYTFYLKNILNQFGSQSVEEVESDSNYRDRNKSYKYALPSKYLTHIFRPVKSIVSNDNCQFIGKVEQAIEAELGVKINLVQMTKKHIEIFKIKEKYYLKLFKQLQPKKIVITCSYGKEALIAAARKCAAEIIELQHGTISKYHLGYSFPNNKNIPYFPDKLLLFGQYWSDSTPIPLPKDKIRNVGYRFFDLKGDNKIEDKNNKILFLSQGTVADKLSSLAYEFASQQDSYKVVYKLHPSEYKSWRKHANLAKASKLDNFTVIDSSKVSLYELFEESEFQVGVYSTAIYEGLAFGLKTILVNTAGIENMEFLVDNNYVMRADNYCDLISNITDYKAKKIFRDYIFENVSDEHVFMNI